jgi:AmiR/NasT family two-component response regulator
MDKKGITEPQAHKYLQQKSMETSSKMTDTLNNLKTFDGSDLP